MTDTDTEPVGVFQDGDFLYVNTVFTAPGQARVGSDNWRKSRLWVLENREVIIVVPGEGSDVERRNLGKALSVTRPNRKQLDVVLESDPELVVSFLEASCGCGMGAVASAGPVVGPWRIARVRKPNWFTTAP